MVDHGDDRPEDEAGGQARDDGAGGERVAKALARAGVASRRDVERYIAAGRVALNGKTLDTPAVKVGPGDVLTVDGEVVGEAEPARLWRHHKPPGLLTSHGDPQGRPTVFEHLPEGLPRVISVGRLDLASEGLLLLTNDGELARSLELPDTGWRRTYRARAWGRADPARLEGLKAGVTVDGVRYGPIDARLDKATGKGAVGRGRVSEAPANLWITVTVSEGKNREVRRVLESLGLKVNRLIRLAYGPFVLGTLAPGEVEEVGPRVLREQLDGLIPPERMPRGDRRPGPVVRGHAPAPAPGPSTVRPKPRDEARAPARSGPRPAAHGSREAVRDAAGPKRTFSAGGKAARSPAGAGRPRAQGREEGRDEGRAPASERPRAPFAAQGRGPRTAGKPGPSFGKPRSGPAKPRRADEGDGPRHAGASKGAAAGPRGFKAGEASGPRGKAGAKPGGKGQARPGAAPAPGDKRTGMELTPPMRRSARRKPGPPGPRRPPRDA